MYEDETESTGSTISESLESTGTTESSEPESALSVSRNVPDLSIPEYPPEMAPLKLITMTINSNIATNLNLDVIARSTALNDEIVGVRYRDITRGQVKSKSKGKTVQPDGQDPDRQYFKSNTTSGRFKNQCTFVVNVEEGKDINTKVFNNGKMVNVGCMKPEHAVRTAEILCRTFQNMEGLVIYEIPDTIQTNNLKKFFKDDLRKKFGQLIQLLVCELDMDMNLDPFDASLTADEAYESFLTEIADCPNYQSDIMYLYTIISILKSYYNEKGLVDHFNDPEFRYILTMIINHTDREKAEIACVFPAYLNNKDIIKFDRDTVKVALINKSTNCQYFLNRSALVAGMAHVTGVSQCEYDKDKYPGVIIVYETDTKPVKIILFNTGKINITSARTHEQVQQAYDFISQYCRNYFADLLLRTEYLNRIKEYENKLPAQYDLGIIDDKHYYLLKKSSVTSHPRNVRFLSSAKLLNEYREK